MVGIAFQGFPNVVPNIEKTECKAEIVLEIVLAIVQTWFRENMSCKVSVIAFQIPIFIL